MAPETIQVSYEQLAEVTARFGRMAAASEALTRQIQGPATQLIAEGWQGQGAEAFAAELHDDLLPALSRLSAMLHEGQAVTEAISARFRAGEEQAAQLLVDDPAQGGGPGGAAAITGGAAPGGWNTTGSTQWSAGPFSFSRRTADGSMYGQVQGGDPQAGIDFTSGGRWEGLDFRYRGAEGRLFGKGFETESKIGAYQTNATGTFEAGTGEGGVGLAVDGKGYIAGGYYEVAGAKGELESVQGNAQLGLTNTVRGKLLSSAGFIGLRNNSLGGEIGVNIASVEVERGLNIAGANVGVKAEVGLKWEIGFQIGKNTEIKAGPFSFGISFGKAKTGKLD